MSTRSPSTISASFPSVRPRKSRRIGSTGSQPSSVDERDGAAAVLVRERRTGEVDARHARTVRGVGERSTEFVALGHAGSEHYAGLETFENPGVASVEMRSDELTAVCPITGQPDLYTATISYRPEGVSASSRSRSSST